jgi:hypothetical protein
MNARALRYDQPAFFVGLQPQGQPAVAAQVPTREGGEVVLADELRAVPRQLETALLHAGLENDARAYTYEQIDPAVVLPPQRETDRNLLPLQQWEGVVTRVSTEEFTVTLRDITHPETPEEEATVPIAEITREDRRLLVPGAVLYWNIGYQTIRASGQIQRVSEIRLRRLPAWSARDIDRVAQRARALREKFGLDDPDDATRTE